MYLFTLFSYNSRDSQTEKTLENVFPVNVCDEDSCEMDVDENSPDPSCRYLNYIVNID